LYKLKHTPALTRPQFFGLSFVGQAKITHLPSIAPKFLG
jgi:hypothetical protein